MRIKPITSFVGGFCETQHQRALLPHVAVALTRGGFSYSHWTMVQHRKWVCLLSGRDVILQMDYGSPGREGILPLCRKGGQETCDITCWEDSHLTFYSEAEAF